MKRQSAQNPSPRTRATAILAAAFSAAALAFTSAAGATPLVGIGDNGPSMFADANFQALGAKISRKVIPYDFWRSPSETAELEQWMAGATADGVEPLIAFSHSDDNPHRLPSVAEFRTSLGKLIRRYPALTDFSPWNEANHVSQPTFRNPRRAAQFFNAARSICPACRIVAADVLDQANMLPWVKSFRKIATRPALWGLHSYGDGNRGVSWNRSATRKLLGAVRGKVWMTEVGGLVAFKNHFAYNETRAANATRNVLRIAVKSPRIERVYFYSWYGTDQPRYRRPLKWDSGVVSAAGSPRPAYYVIKDWLASHR